MSIKKVLIWFKATRPFSFTGSVIPVVVGAIIASKETKFQVAYFLLSVLAIVLLHSSVNLINDSEDFLNKVDTDESYGTSRTIRDKLLTQREVLIGGYVFLGLAVILGLFLAYERGIFILYLGLLGALVGYFYTCKPLTLKYRGLGTPFVFFIFGPLILIGGYYIQAQRLSIPALLVSVPLGLLTTAILHANDMRDMGHDEKAGIKTLSIVIGENAAKKVYLGLIFIPYILICLMVAFKILPLLSLICLITLISAVKKAKMLRLKENLMDFDKETAQLTGQFGVLLIISLLF